MDAILEPLRDLFEGTIDFEGQRLADLISTIALSIVGAIAFLAGFFTQDIYNTLYVGLAGTGLTFLIVVPPWPFYNKHPLPFLPARNGNPALSGIQLQVDGRKIQ